MKKFSPLLSLGVTAFFFACGDDSGSNSETNTGNSGNTNNEDSREVESIKDLNRCSDEREGDTVYVADQMRDYLCHNHAWIDLFELLEETNSSSSVSTSSSSVTSSSSSTDENEAGSSSSTDESETDNSSSSGKNDDGSSSSSEKGEVNSSSSSGKNDENSSSSTEENEEIGAITGLNITGVAQKGPFTMGSNVTVRELKDGKALTQTSQFFEGMITSNDGKYSISDISLASPYALLEANGYYRNEVSGSNSSSTIKLYAYTDLSDRKKANINVLTHLEYFRICELMANSDGTLKLTNAKKQAQKEIFAAFGIDATNFDASEDLNIFGTSDQSAALLAMSILLKGDRSEADLTVLLTALGQDMAKDGNWNDAATRAKIADWADSVDLGLKGTLTLSKIRSNVSGWSLGGVPAFEKYVRNFWYNEYGLGTCDESNKNEVGRDTNSRSTYYASKYAYAGYSDKKVRFICDEKSKHWRHATDIEKDTAGWGNNFKNGDVRNGQVNTSLVYVYEDGNWRHGTALDSSIKAGGYACTKERLGDYFKDTKGNYQICTAQQSTPDTLRKWVAASTLDNDIYEARSKCSAATDGDLMNGRVNTSKVYACNGTTGWKEITDGLSKTLGGCYTNLIDSVGLYSGTYYVCLSNGWVRASEARVNTVHYECNKNGELLKGLVDTDKYFTCDADTFRVETDAVAISYFEKACVSYLESPTKVTSKNGTKWTCENHKWVWDDKAIAGTMTDVRDGKKYKTTVIKTQTWMAENLNYDYNEGTAKSYCNSNSSTNCDKYGRQYLWSAAMDSAAVFSDAGKGCGYGVTCTVASASSATLVRGVCPEGWHLPSNSDWSTLWGAIGGTSTAGTKLKSTSGWNSSGNGEDAYGFSVLPAGYYLSGPFRDAGNYGYFWSSTENNSINAYYKYFRYNYSYVREHSDDKNYGFSVRCLKD